MGIEPGYASVVGLAAAHRARLVVVADEVVPASTRWVVGANAVDAHLVDAEYGRDFVADRVGPVALAYDGAPDEASGEPLRVVRGVEVGNVFQLGTRYTDALGATWLDEAGAAQPFVLGSYGIGVGRLLACIAEHHRDEHGLALPASVAPFDVAVVSLGRDPATAERARALAAALRGAGVTALLDDRDLGAGAKLADADLRGSPLRLVVGERGLRRGVAELRRRLATWRHDGPGTTRPGEVREVPLEDVVAAVRTERDALRSELHSA
ncbi:MAG: His/Gly/Thr/Pro-type tRNA ligase C-terminal domain-containing protein [Myxococcota bacterium]